MSPIFSTLLLSFIYANLANAYWLMGIKDFITSERMDPIVNPGAVSSHAHSVLGGSNFSFNTTTAQLRQSQCTSVPIPQDNSNYWFPHLYFQWSNGSFTSLTGGAVIYYLFSDTPGVTTPFPDDLRMLSGTTTLRSYNASSFAQQAVTFLCLDFSGTSTKYNEIPAQDCPDGIRAQINFPSCWDGKNTDSADHKSHVSFLSQGPDSGTCSDPKYPITLPRIFIEVYWGANDFSNVRSQAKNTSQPFVFSNGDPTGYGYHADFINGWDTSTLQKAVDGCNCNPSGDPTCCVDAGIFDYDTTTQCHITPQVDELVLGTLPKLPGNNPVQSGPQDATTFEDTNIPDILSPVTAYTGSGPPPGACQLTGQASVVSSSNGYGYSGCMVDGSPRTLSNTLQPSNKSIEGCLAVAKAAGYKYAGMEYGAECYAANTIGSGRTMATDGRCNMPCNDDSTSICGGPLGISMYTLGATPNITINCERSSGSSTPSQASSLSYGGSSTSETFPILSTSISSPTLSAGGTSPITSSTSVISSISSSITSLIKGPSVTSTFTSPITTGTTYPSSDDSDDDDLEECWTPTLKSKRAKPTRSLHGLHRRRLGPDF